MAAQWLIVVLMQYTVLTLSIKFTFFFIFHKEVAVLKSFLQPQSKVPKHLSDTRWDAHAKAMGAILESYSTIANALSHLHSDISEKGDTRLHANNLLQKIENWNLYLCFSFGPECKVVFTGLAKPLEI